MLTIRGFISSCVRKESFFGVVIYCVRMTKEKRIAMKTELNRCSGYLQSAAWCIRRTSKNYSFSPRICHVVWRMDAAAEHALATGSNDDHRRRITDFIRKCSGCYFDRWNQSRPRANVCWSNVCKPKQLSHQRYRSTVELSSSWSVVLVHSLTTTLDRIVRTTRWANAREDSVACAQIEYGSDHECKRASTRASAFEH